ncbi:MAG: hypothetical protein BWY80_00376 [Firmicutes bacterium ADurb.Bin456]|nr:MAG: hypothetical protein BWY80_00376 [Firmicutes bacterium ADurb.Bin456]
MILICASGAMAFARSVIFILGILGTKTSPPCICSMALITKRTPCSNDIQKRVILSSVMVNIPLGRCLMNNGTTEPREPTTLP